MRIKLIFLSIALLMITGCAASFKPRPLAEVNFLERAQTKSQGNMRVTAAVLSAEETEQVFGFALYKKGIQPVWLQVENNETEPTWFLPFGLDPDYFPPLEVAYPYHRTLQPEYNRQIDMYFQQQAMGLYIAPGGIRSGFIFLAIVGLGKMAIQELFVVSGLGILEYQLESGRTGVALQYGFDHRTNFKYSHCKTLQGRQALFFCFKK